MKMYPPSAGHGGVLISEQTEVLNRTRTESLLKMRIKLHLPFVIIMEQNEY